MPECHPQADVLACICKEAILAFYPSSKLVIGPVVPGHLLIVMSPLL